MNKHLTTRLLRAGALLIACAGSAGAVPLPPYPFVTASGKAETWLAPDLGELQFDIVVQNNEAAAALAIVNAVSTELTASFVAHGVADTDIEAFDLGKKTIPVNQKQAGDPPFATIVTRHMRVPVRDLAQWPALIGALLGHENLDNLHGAFDRSDRDRIESQLAVDAARNARQSATNLALAFGRKLGPVMAISSGSLVRLGAPFGFAPEAASGAAARTGAAPPPEPATPTYAVPHALLLTQSVNTVFKLQ